MQARGNRQRAAREKVPELREWIDEWTEIIDAAPERCRQTRTKTL
jgi:hypothetical protein